MVNKSYSDYSTYRGNISPKTLVGDFVDVTSPIIIRNLVGKAFPNAPIEEKNYQGLVLTPNAPAANDKKFTP